MYQIVTSLSILSEIKRSKYFKQNLGLSATLETGAEFRSLNHKDEFAFSYNSFYKTIIYSQGNVGNIRFYVDHYIKEPVLATYKNLEEFIIPFDINFIKEKGIDAYLGHILLKVDTEYDERMEENKSKEENSLAKKGNSDKLTTNPGAVNYEDIKDYLKNKRY